MIVVCVAPSVVLSVVWSVRLSAWLRVVRRVAQVEMAISRTKKEETVEKAKKELENCYLVASLNYKAFTVSQWTMAPTIALPP